MSAAIRVSCVAALALCSLLANPRSLIAQRKAPGFSALLSLPTADDVIGFPRAVSADAHTGEVFVCDARESRILIFDDLGMFTYQIPGGQVFSAPQDIAIDPEGYLLLVAHRQLRRTLLELDFDGLFLREIELAPLPEGSRPTRLASIALSPAGDRLYATDEANLKIWIADRDGEVEGAIDLSGGIELDRADDQMLGHVDVYGEEILIAMASEGRIRRFALDGRALTPVGQPGSGSCQLQRPVAAARNLSGEVFVIDQLRMVVTRWRLEGNRCLGEYLGLGTAPGYLYFPMDLTLNPTGQLLISQGFEGRIQVYGDLTGPPSPPGSR